MAMNLHAVESKDKRMSIVRMGFLAAAALCLITDLNGQETPLAWDAAASFKCNIVSATFNPTTRRVTVVGNVSNPLSPSAAPYDVFDPVAPTCKAPATLRVLVGWNAETGTTELVNTGSLPAGPSLTSTARGWMNVSPPAPGATSPAGPTSINVLAAAMRKRRPNRANKRTSPRRTNRRRRISHGLSTCARRPACRGQRHCPRERFQAALQSAASAERPVGREPSANGGGSLPW